MSRPGFFRPFVLPSVDAGAESRTDSPPPNVGDRLRSTMLPHLDAAYGYARYLTRNGPAAEDIVQEAFLRAIRGIDGWRGDNAKGWLLAIVRNCFLDAVGTRRDPLHDAEPIEAIDRSAARRGETEQLEERVEKASDAAMLRQTIETLPEPFREALILRELEEFSYKQIAAITQVPIGTVMSRLARARSLLTERLLPLRDHAREAR